MLLRFTLFSLDLYRVSAPDDFEEITGSGQEFPSARKKEPLSRSSTLFQDQWYQGVYQRKGKQNALEVKDDLLVNPDSQNNSPGYWRAKNPDQRGEGTWPCNFSNCRFSKGKRGDISLGLPSHSLLASLCPVTACLPSLCLPDFCSDLGDQADDQADEALGSNSQSPIHSQDEIGVLKQQINDLYHHLLEVIDNLEQQKQENLKLEQMKVEFLRGGLAWAQDPSGKLEDYPRKYAG